MRPVTASLPQTRFRHPLIIAVLCAIIMLGGVALWADERILKTWETLSTTARERITETMAASGVRLTQITVEGRQYTSPADLLSALDVEQGSPLLSLDLQNARKRLENLPWIKSASIERRLPGNLHIHLTERTPIALWQQPQGYVLIDADGTLIVENIAGFEHFPLVVGDGAAEAASDLFTLLAAQPSLKNRVKAAVRIGKRRWNLWLDSLGNDGLELRLPENVSPASLARLVEKNNRNTLLSRNLAMIDLRLSDRIIIREAQIPSSDGAKPKHEKKQTSREENPAYN